MARQPESFRLFGIPYTPFNVHGDIVYVFSTATVAPTLPPPPPGVVNVFYNTINHIDYENPNLCVITIEYDQESIVP